MAIETIAEILAILGASAAVAMYIKKQICKDLTALTKEVREFNSNAVHKIDALDERVERLEEETMRR